MSITMYAIDCPDCLPNIEWGITTTYPPCSYVALAYKYVQAGYVGNVCIENTQERLNISSAAFWLYSMNMPNNFFMDELMLTPYSLYGSTLENTFAEDFCNYDYSKPGGLEWGCDTYNQLQEVLGDCCETLPFGGCTEEIFGPGSDYVARTFVTFGGIIWIRSTQAYAGPAPHPNPGVTPGEWYNIGSTNCAAIQSDPTYSYWFINADTFPVQGSRYALWEENIINYVLDDRVVFNGDVWKVAIAGPLAGGWATRPGAVPGQWIKLS